MVMSKGANELQLVWVSKNYKKAQILYKSTNHGKYTMILRIADENISGSPFVIRVIEFLSSWKKGFKIVFINFYASFYT
jgi:hypothetical protein